MDQHDHEHMQHQQPNHANQQPHASATAGDIVGHGGHAGHGAAEEPAAKHSVSAHAGDTQTEERHDQHNQAGMAHSGMGQMGATIPLAYRPTRAQIAAVSFLSVLALTAALIFSASYTNLRLSARRRRRDHAAGPDHDLRHPWPVDA